jgi:hypothetical protein
MPKMNAVKNLNQVERNLFDFSREESLSSVNRGE